MRNRRPNLISPLLFGLLFAGADPVAADTLAPQPDPRQPSAAPAQSFIGVMGQVARPGVYEFSQESPVLLDVIQHAGGVTDKASGRVHVVRRGRPIQQVYLSSSSLPFTLFPDDVVIVDEQGSRGGLQSIRHAGDEQSEQSGSEPSRDSAFVQVAFVNLVEHPVVLKMRGEQATVADIVSLLGQRPEVVPSVGLIPTAAGQAVDPQHLTPTTPLPSGSILVFDPAVIQFEQMPPLPTPQKIGRSAQPPLQTADGRSGDGAEDGGPALTAAEGGRLPELATAPAEPAGQSSSDAENESLAKSPESAPVPEPIEEARTNAESLQKEAGTSRSSAVVLWIIGTLAMLSTLVLLWPAIRRHVISDILPATRRKGRVLDALINDELPLTVEPCELPSSLQLHGRPGGAAKMRLDAAHHSQAASGPRPPHIRPSDLQASTVAGESADGNISAVSGPDPSWDGNGFEADSKTEAAAPSAAHSTGDKKTKLLDRVLSSVHGAVRT